MKMNHHPVGAVAKQITVAAEATPFLAAVRASRFLAVALLSSIVVVGCDNGSKTEIPNEVLQLEQAPNPLPRFLRGTVRYEAELQGYGPTLAQGYGLVVGLNGTGSADTPISVRAVMEREASRMLEDPRVDAERFNLAELLDSKDTAVVLVEASIPPGAPGDTFFDVQVSALPTTSTTSLEGGKLWTTFLRRGLASPTAPHTEPVASAKGELFVNPFAEQASEGQLTSVNRRRGRVLNGGVSLKSMPLALQLRTPSFSRSRAVTNAINTRFPLEFGQRNPTARPVSQKSDEQIVINVPPSWAAQTDEFVEVLMHTPIDTRGLEERAFAYSRWVEENPIHAPSIAWCWVAVGQRSVPAIQKFYDHAEQVPRLAALKAGAKLEDPLVVPHLASIAEDKTSPIRRDVIDMLGEMDGNPLVGTVLRRLLDDPDRVIRVAAFEGLLRQGDAIIQSIPTGRYPSFALFQVPSSFPMLYVSQHEAPYIAVFGRGLEVPRPVFASTWSDRFMVRGETATDPLEVYYRDIRTGESKVYETDADLVSFVRFLGNKLDYPGAEVGLSLSYDRTISALYAMHSTKQLGAPLVIERDQLQARLLAGVNQIQPEDRPETRRDESGIIDPLSDPNADDFTPIGERPESRDPSGL